MPRIFRSMKKDADGHPLVGRSAAALGVRVPPDKKPDIVPDASGVVHPGTGGMSVAPSLADLPYFMVPVRLQNLVPNAFGRNDRFVWRWGDGPFTAAPMADDLQLVPNSPTHAVVEPNRAMLLPQFEAALAATRADWIVDESGS
jgi:hypothetical protein